MDLRLKRGRPVGRRVLLERQTCCFYLLGPPHERKEESRVGGSTLGASSDAPRPLSRSLIAALRQVARTIEGDRLAHERLEGGRVNFFPFVDVDRAAYVSVETRVEETGWILQKRALGEGELHDILVGFAGADDAVVRPNRGAHPLPLLDDVGGCFLDELAHSAEGFPAPVPEFGDSFRDELRCRLALARARLFPVLILEVPEEGLRQFPPRCALARVRSGLRG